MIANLDELINNTFASDATAPAEVFAGGTLRPSVRVTDAGPGAFVGPADLDRGFDAWYGAPGYGVELEDRILGDSVIRHDYHPAIGVNPWDHIFGTLGAGDTFPAPEPREWPNQSSRESLS